MSKIRFVPRQGNLVAIYREDAVPLLERLRKQARVEYARFSHINPTPDGQHFQIDWVDPAVINVLGESVTLVDGQGRPFTTKGQAELFEISLLETLYLKIRSE